MVIGIREIVSELKTRLSEQGSILDIGFGTGRVSFKILREMPVAKITGVERMKREKIEEDHELFVDEEVRPAIIDRLKSIRGDKRIHRYDYFKFLAEGEYNENLKSESFNKIVNVFFNKSFKDFIVENKSQFDLVILFNVLHYTEIGEVKTALDKVTSILTQKGLILIGFKDFIETEEIYNDRQKINVPETIKYLESNFETLLNVYSEVERSTIYLARLCNPK